jgi:hypothetical protein
VESLVDEQTVKERTAVRDKQETSQNDIYKVIGALTMLIDHLGVVFLAGSGGLYLAARFIGRLAFPIFAYQLSLGYKYTSNLRQYILRLSVFALISQVPFTILRNQLHVKLELNIIFTLLLGLSLLYSYDNDYKLLGAIAIILGFLLPVEYGAYGVLLPLTFHLFDSRFKLIGSQGLIMGAAGLANWDLNYLFQIPSLFAVLIIKYQFLTRIRVNKYFFYIFYPGHLGLLAIIHYLFL